MPCDRHTSSPAEAFFRHHSKPQQIGRFGAFFYGGRAWLDKTLGIQFRPTRHHRKSYLFLTGELQMNAIMLRMPAVVAATGDARSTIYARISEKLFVSGVRTGRRSVAWPSSEIQAINNARIAGKSEEEIRALVDRLHAARKAAQ